MNDLRWIIFRMDEKCPDERTARILRIADAPGQDAIIDLARRELQRDPCYVYFAGVKPYLWSQEMIGPASPELATALDANETIYGYPSLRTGRIEKVLEV